MKELRALVTLLTIVISIFAFNIPPSKQLSR